MRAYYRAKVSEFLEFPPELVLGKLEDGLAAEGFARTPEQRTSWRNGIEILRNALGELRREITEAPNWGLLLEYPIPGRQKRIDAVVLTSRGIIVIEFKDGGTENKSGHRHQLLEYCWNIRDFHRASSGNIIAPILCPTELAQEVESRELRIEDSRQRIMSLQVVGRHQLALAISGALRVFPESGSSGHSLESWDESRISPSQSIIEATRELFGQHTVREIEHSHSDDTNKVVETIAEIVRHSRDKNVRSICFVTGVPGAGKTLVGLRVAYLSQATALAESGPCFASGNLKLLKVLGQALGLNVAKSRADVRSTVHDLTAPLWDVHRFARLHLSDSSGEPPAFRVVVFDEAQRVWTATKVTKATRQRAQRGNRGPELPLELTTCSEPEHLLRVMERLSWCVVVALVGGGQEIHDGEAGLKEWGDVLRQRLKNWQIWGSPEALRGAPSLANQKLFQPPIEDSQSIRESPKLNLNITRRSYRAERVTDWVNAVLEGDEAKARENADSLTEFQIELTRDLLVARQRLRSLTQDDQRIGLIASSGAKRLRAEGVEVQKQFRDALNWPKWFLAPPNDLDASNSLEVAATEFECQGLELDHTCLCWGTDLLYINSAVGWWFRQSRGKTLKKLDASAEGPYVLNKYRVLLTRAREGLILFVPNGDPADRSRPPEHLDSTAHFLIRCGANLICRSSQ